MSGSMTILIILVTLLHVAAFAVWMWIRLRRDEGKDSTTNESANLTPCAVCGAPATQWGYDGFDPNERHDPYTGRAYSLDMTHYQPLCATHAPKPTGTRLGQPVKAS